MYPCCTAPPSAMFGNVYVQGIMYAPMLEGIASYLFDRQDDFHITVGQILCGVETATACVALQTPKHMEISICVYLYIYIYIYGNVGGQGICTPNRGDIPGSGNTFFDLGGVWHTCAGQRLQALFLAVCMCKVSCMLPCLRALPATTLTQRMTLHYSQSKTLWD